MASFIARSLLVFCVIVAAGMLTPHSSNAQSFDNCRVSGESATIIVPSDVTTAFGNNGQRSIGTNDVIAAYTDDGTCAGKSDPWNGSQQTVPVFLEAQLPGYTSGEPLTLRIYDASEDEQFEFSFATGELTFTNCSELSDISPLCQDDGLYASLSVYQVESFIDSDDQALPVELTSFDADVDGSTVVLQWETASETNNAGFSVQHQPPDAERWSTLDFVSGNGTTQRRSQYRYNARSLGPGTHRFRLLQRDVDNTTSLSPVITARVRLGTAFRLTQPSPHPVRSASRMTLYVREAQAVRVELFNLLGQRVKTLLQASLPADQATPIALTAANLASGRYMIRVTGESFRETVPVTILR